jgi:hypothetical protein
MSRSRFSANTARAPGSTTRLTDIRARLDHLRVLAEDVQSGETYACDAEMDELQRAMETLQNEPEVLMREGPDL